MAHAQRADLVFQRNERAHLYRWGCQFSRLLAFLQCGSAENDCIIVSKYVDLLPCVSVCHQIPFSLYHPISEHTPKVIIPAILSGKSRHVSPVACIQSVLHSQGVITLATLCNCAISEQCVIITFL